MNAYIVKINFTRWGQKRTATRLANADNAFTARTRALSGFVMTHNDTFRVTGSTVDDAFQHGEYVTYTGLTEVEEAMIEEIIDPIHGIVIRFINSDDTITVHSNTLTRS